MNRLSAGDRINGRAIETIQMRHIEIPDSSHRTHLQFRPFAGCPMCNLHIQSFVRKHAELLGNGIQEVAIFHSSQEKMLEHHYC